MGMPYPNHGGPRRGGVAYHNGLLAQNDDAIDLSTPDGKPEARKADGSADKADQQTNDSKDKNGQAQSQQGTQSATQTNTEQRDTTFDDLMNFNDFDLASFGVGDGGMDDGGGAAADASS